MQENNGMKRVYVNEEWCLGCHLCEYNCALAQTGESDMAKALKGKKIYPNILIESTGNVNFAVNCRHCDDPLCVKNCIAGALSKNGDGVVTVDKDKCVGCFTCVLSCPYGCISPTDEGVMHKCTLCISTGEGTPRCVAGCPNNAIVFTDER